MSIEPSLWCDGQDQTSLELPPRIDSPHAALVMFPGGSRKWRPGKSHRARMERQPRQVDEHDQTIDLTGAKRLKPGSMCAANSPRIIIRNSSSGGGGGGSSSSSRSTS